MYSIKPMIKMATFLINLLHLFVDDDNVTTISIFLYLCSSSFKASENGLEMLAGELLINALMQIITSSDLKNRHFLTFNWKNNF